ncbi:hypothetical protein EJB05_22156 [Eragrostis curvula]|uniref:Myb-like domain-containing protein n=1 Tax=Eragrostis curvula TaxID=38414 RepID=A0A5J9V3Q6_9POAL|nr:hypothetical protein EJB05_22156 [Eragrostis curvula]
MEEDDMEIELLLAEPRNEEYHLEEYLGGVLDHSSQAQDDCTVYWSGGTEQQDEVDAFLEPSVFGSFLPWGTLLHGPRGTRRRSQSWKGEVSHQFASQYPCTSGGRKSNDHWSHDEVMKLVDGISTYGVGNWIKIKDAHFLTSIRETSHLKGKT